MFFFHIFAKSQRKKAKKRKTLDELKCSSFCHCITAMTGSFNQLMLEFHWPNDEDFQCTI